MGYKETIISKVEGLVLPICEEQKFELIEVDYLKEAGNWYLRVFLDKEGGFTINDCELVSRAIDKPLDDFDFIKEQYILEVSSPGLDRPLKNEKDYIRNVNKLIEVKLFKPFEGSKLFEGILVEYTADTLTIEMGDKNKVTFNKKDTAIIKPVIEF